MSVPANAPQSARRMDLRVLVHHGEAREAALAQAEAELDAIVDELLRVQAAGGRANISLAARLAGIARDTIYARLRARSTENTHTNGRTPA